MFFRAPDASGAFFCARIREKEKSYESLFLYFRVGHRGTEGHPDKICDQISDAVLDAILEKDPNGRVACETTASTGLVHIMGEISTNCYVDIQKIAREVIREIGYDRAKYGFDCDTCGILVNIDEQSSDIALGTNDEEDGEAPDPGAQGEAGGLSAAGRQDPGDGGV